MENMQTLMVELEPKHCMPKTLLSTTLYNMVYNKNLFIK